MKRNGGKPYLVLDGSDSGSCRSGRHHRRPGRDGQGSRAIPVPRSASPERHPPGGRLLVTRPDDERRSRSLHGLSRTINNMVIGVTEGYSKQPEIVGTGYRVAAKGQSIELSLLLSHRDR